MPEELSLTDIDGIGPARAETLEDELGVDGAIGLLDVTVDDLTSTTNLSDESAEEILGEVEAFYTQDVDSEDAAEDEGEEPEEETTEDVADPDPDADESAGSPTNPWTVEDVEQYVADAGGEAPTDDTYAVPLELDDQVLLHVLHVVLEEATRQHQASNSPMRNSAYRLASKLMSVSLSAGEEIDVTLIVKGDELNAFYRALSQGATDYAGRAGIPSMYGDFENLRNVVNESRQQMMDD